MRPAKLPEFKLTPRALALLAYVAKYRLISSDDLARLDGGSAQNVKRELRIIWAHGYILRPSKLRPWRDRPQPLSTDFQIEAHGCFGITAILSIPTSTGRRTAGGPAFASSIIRLHARDSWRRRGCAARSGDTSTSWKLRDHCARPGEDPTLRAIPLKWTALVPDGRGGEVAASVISDDLFALVFIDGTAAYFCGRDRSRANAGRRGESSREEVIAGKRRLRTYYMQSCDLLLRLAATPARRAIRRRTAAGPDRDDFRKAD